VALIMYTISYIDRTNISSRLIQDLQHDEGLHMDSAMKAMRRHLLHRLHFAADPGAYLAPAGALGN